jgi:hypothetical protein
LKPGEYKVEVLDQKAVIRGSNVSAEAPVKVETADTKFGRTSLRFNSSNGKMQIQEIRLGGTNMKLVLSEPAAN